MDKIKIFTSLFLTSIILVSCQTLKEWTGFRPKTAPSFSSLEWNKTLELPDSFVFQETVVNNITGISYAAQQKKFFILPCDTLASSRSRFYEMVIKDWKTEPVLQFKSVHFLSERNNKNFMNKTEFLEKLSKRKTTKFEVPKPEDIVYSPKDKQLCWLSSSHYLLYDSRAFQTEPFITKMDENGRMTLPFALPRMLKETQDSFQQKTNLKAISITPSGNYLFAAPNYYLPKDAPVKGSNDTGFVRIFQFRNDARSLAATYAYPIDIPNDPEWPTVQAQRSIVSLAAISDSTILVLEKIETKQAANRFVLYQVALSKSFQISNRKSLVKDKKFMPLIKKKIADLSDFSDLPQVLWEGMSLGPVVDGKQSLILVNDNQGLPESKTFFALFWLRP